MSKHVVALERTNHSRSADRRSRRSVTRPRPKIYRQDVRLAITAELQHYRETHPPPVQGRSLPIREILECIHSDLFDSELNVRELMMRCRLRDHNVSSRFRHELGVPIKTYIESLRLGAAHTLIASGVATVTDAAQSVGYRYSQTFYRVEARHHADSVCAPATGSDHVANEGERYFMRAAAGKWSMTALQRGTVEAAMRRILPSDDGPGATEANAIGFVDWIACQSRFRPLVDRFSIGVALLDSLATAIYRKSFPSCQPSEQDVLLDQLGAIPHASARGFLTMLVNLTLTAFLCPPTYSGNRDAVGWQYIGFIPHPLTTGAGAISTNR